MTSPTRISVAGFAVFKKAKVKLDLLTNIDMLLIVEKSISGRICDAI